MAHACCEGVPQSYTNQARRGGFDLWVKVEEFTYINSILLSPWQHNRHHITVAHHMLGISSLIPSLWFSWVSGGEVKRVIAALIGQLRTRATLPFTRASQRDSQQQHQSIPSHPTTLTTTTIPQPWPNPPLLPTPKPQNPAQQPPQRTRAL
jgi:hypothetical protein